MWRDVLTSNPSARWPWTDHVRPFSDLPSAAIKEAIEFDQHLWAIAETDPDEAAKESVYSGIHYRSGAPRMGEPLYRSRGAAERGQRSMYCGRGTGHLGTGLYFFGTLSAATKEGAWTVDSRLAGMSESALRKALRGITVVDVSSLVIPTFEDWKEWAQTHDIIRYPDKPKSLAYEAFGKALLCYPGALVLLSKKLTELDGMQVRLADVNAQIDALLDGPDDEQLSEAASEAIDTLWYERDDLWRDQKALDSRIGDVRSDLHAWVTRIDWNAPRWESVPDRPSEYGIDRSPSLIESYQPLPPRAQAAVDAFERDITERRFPGFHPMTYYMRSIGVAAIVQRDWTEHNDGMRGCIWYPEAPE
jgi:hypothetical protein